MAKSDKIEPTENQRIVFRAVLICFLLFLLIKIVWINHPNESPKEIASKVIDFMQLDNSNSTQKEEVRKYFSYTPNFMDNSSNSSNSDKIISIRSVDEQKAKAVVTVDIENSYAKTPMQLKFTKEGSFFSGYKWIIQEVVD